MQSRLAVLDLADWLLIGGMFGIIAFTILYGLRSRWWLYIEGIALFAKSATLALVSSQVVATIIFGTDYWGRWLVRPTVYILFFGSSWFFVYALARRQNREARRRKPLEKELREARRREGLTTERRTVMEALHDWRQRNR